MASGDIGNQKWTETYVCHTFIFLFNRDTQKIELQSFSSQGHSVTQWHSLCGPHWGCAASKSHFLSLDSSVKGVVLAKIPSPIVYFLLRKPLKLAFWGYLIVCFRRIYLIKGIFGLKFLKSTQEKTHGMFSTKVSLAKGIRSKNRSSTPL